MEVVLVLLEGEGDGLDWECGEGIFDKLNLLNFLFVFWSMIVVLVGSL